MQNKVTYKFLSKRCDLSNKDRDLLAITYIKQKNERKLLELYTIVCNAIMSKFPSIEQGEVFSCYYMAIRYAIKNYVDITPKGKKGNAHALIYSKTKANCLDYLKQQANYERSNNELMDLGIRVCKCGYSSIDVEEDSEVVEQMNLFYSEEVR